MAKIQLNGDPYEISNGTNLIELLKKLKIKKNKVTKLGVKVRGVSELHTVCGTLWAGLMKANTDFNDKLARIS